MVLGVLLENKLQEYVSLFHTPPGSSLMAAPVPDELFSWPRTECFKAQLLWKIQCRGHSRSSQACLAQSAGKWSAGLPTRAEGTAAPLLRGFKGDWW